MITSATTPRLASPIIAPDDLPPTGHESPQDARDAGWLGQVPPPSPARPSERPAPIDDALDAQATLRDREDAGWIGQVPPPPIVHPEDLERVARTPGFDTEPITGHESPAEARDAGWLGQVPPAEDPAPRRAPDPEPQYANPGMAPEPWKDSGSLFDDDPTLFG